MTTDVAAPPAEGLRMELSPAQEEARAAFAAYADEHVAPHAGAWDRAAATPRDAVERLAATGWLGAVLPSAHGGVGMDWVTFGLLNEELGRALVSESRLTRLDEAELLARADRWRTRITATRTS